MKTQDKRAKTFAEKLKAGARSMAASGRVVKSKAASMMTVQKSIQRKNSVSSEMVKMFFTTPIGLTVDQLQWRKIQSLAPLLP